MNMRNKRFRKLLKIQMRYQNEDFGEFSFEFF